jgi:hypothetical protein
LANVLITLSGGTTGAFAIMKDSSFAGESRCVWMASEGFMISAVLSRYQKNVEPGWRVMAWRIAGTRDQEGGEERRGYWSLVGKKVW